MNKISALESYKVSVVLEDVSIQLSIPPILSCFQTVINLFVIGNREVVILGHAEVEHGRGDDGDDV
jgi:hypothetical protein